MNIFLSIFFIVLGLVIILKGFVSKKLNNLKYVIILLGAALIMQGIYLIITGMSAA